MINDRDNSKYTFIHINKCAGGSIYHNFTKHDQEFRLTQIHTKMQFNKLEGLLNDNVKNFFFVRDPVSRFIGCYNFVRRTFKNILCKRTFKSMYNIEYDDVPDLNKMLDKSREDPVFFEFLIKKSPHITAGIAKYLNYVSDDYIEKLHKDNKILMVGTVEHINEDFAKLLDIIKKDSSYTFSKEINTLTSRVHKSKKKGILLSSENIEFIRKFFQDDYECIKKLIKLEYLQPEYLDEIMKKTEYIY